jgi:hypothetical protein
MRYTLYVILVIAVFIIPVFFIFKSPVGQVSSGNITITSPAFENNQKIPIKYTCQDQNINPPLSFSNLPPNTKSLVLIVNDADIKDYNWIHWILWDIDPTNPQIESDTMATNFHIGQNSWNKLEYTGPCPSEDTHRYFFRVFALDTIIGLLKNPSIDLINQQMAGHILDQGQLIGTYK